MRFRIDVTVAVLAVFSGVSAQARCQSAPDPWHVAANQTVSEDIQFTNGAAHLRGTVYLPKNGDGLAAVVVLHHAGLAWHPVSR
jgi:hypothetical protein